MSNCSTYVCLGAIASPSLPQLSLSLFCISSIFCILFFPPLFSFHFLFFLHLLQDWQEEEQECLLVAAPPSPCTSSHNAASPQLLLPKSQHLAILLKYTHSHNGGQHRKEVLGWWIFKHVHKHVEGACMHQSTIVSYLKF